MDDEFTKAMSPALRRIYETVRNVSDPPETYQREADVEVSSYLAANGYGDWVGNFAALCYSKPHDVTFDDSKLLGKEVTWHGPVRADFGQARMDLVEHINRYNGTGSPLTQSGAHVCRVARFVQIQSPEGPSDAKQADAGEASETDGNEQA